MAKKSIAVLDANVLFPASLRDILLDAAEIDLYRLCWSWMILAEMSRNLILQQKVTEAGSQRLLSRMQDIFPEAMITENYAPLIASMTNHPKDRHVLAAAVAKGASIIVTFNIRDFPATALAPYGIVTQTPDEFLLSLYALYPREVPMLIRTQAQTLRNPPKTPLEVLATLAQHAPTFTARVRQDGDW